MRFRERGDDHRSRRGSRPRSFDEGVAIRTFALAEGVCMRRITGYGGLAEFLDSGLAK